MVSAIRQIESENKQKEANKIIIEGVSSYFKEIFGKVDPLSFSINYFRYYLILDFYSTVLWGTREAQFYGPGVLKAVASTKSNEDCRDLINLNIQLTEQYETNKTPIVFLRGKYGLGNFIIDFIEFDSILRNEMIDLYDEYGDYGNFENKLVELMKSCEDFIIKISDNNFIYSKNINEEKNHINLIFEKLKFEFNDKEANYKKYSRDNNKAYKYSKLNTGNNGQSKEETIKNKNTKSLIISIIIFIIVGSIYLNNFLHSEPVKEQKIEVKAIERKITDTLAEKKSLSYRILRNEIINSGVWIPYIRAEGVYQESREYPEIQSCYEDACQVEFINELQTKVRQVSYTICSADRYYQCPGKISGYLEVIKDIEVSKAQADEQFKRYANK
jgi:hypothetical protein